MVLKKEECIFINTEYLVDQKRSVKTLRSSKLEYDVDTIGTAKEMLEEMEVGVPRRRKSPLYREAMLREIEISV